MSRSKLGPLIAGLALLLPGCAAQPANAQDDPAAQQELEELAPAASACASASLIQLLSFT